MAKARAFLSILAAATLAVTMTPSPGYATNGPAQYEYPSNQLSPKYKFTQYNSNAGACYYRIRYGQFGNVAYAQIRFYAGSCGGTQLAVVTHDGTRIEYHWQDGNASGSDGCGTYFEMQATSPANHVVLGLYIRTPYGYAISYWPEPAYPHDTPIAC